MHSYCSSSSQGGHIVGPCTCGLFHHTTQNNSSSFSMLFSMPNHKPFDEYSDFHSSSFAASSSSSSSSVDCTLSLGTPSTRSVTDDHHHQNRHERRPSSCMSNFCWDFLQNKNTSSSSATHKSGRGGSTGGGGSSTNGDPLLARRCANCDTTSTPLWRNGPRGPKSLCNACGIRFKKEERRASAAAATTTTTNGSGGGGGVMEAQQMISHHNNSWIHNSQAHHKMPSCFSPAIGNEFRFIEDDDRDAAADTGGISFLSWRLNVTDRPSLVHDFTR